jgi:DNA-binding transcriptional MerR regulator
MKISELASKTGVSPYRLRHYESLGLITAHRNPSGYRVFSNNTVREVIFVAKCREVRISLEQIGKVLPAYRAGTLTFDEMVDLMENQIDFVDQQIKELRDLRAELVRASQWFKARKQQHSDRKRKGKTQTKTGYGRNG